MSVYRFRDLALVAAPAEMEAKAGLRRLCATLGWQHASRDPGDVSAPVVLRLHHRGSDVPASATPRYLTDEFSILDDDAYPVRERRRVRAAARCRPCGGGCVARSGFEVRGFHRQCQFMKTVDGHGDAGHGTPGVLRRMARPNLSSRGAD